MLKHELVTVVVGLLLFLSYNQHAEAARQLVYRFTARDFMQAGCMRGNEIDNFWKLTPSSKLSLNPKRIGRALSCPIFNDINDGTYSGSPDFEAHSSVYADGCSGNNASLTFDPTVPWFTLSSGSTRCLGSAGLTRIVENNLEEFEDGLLKPIYCKGPFNPLNSNDERCGWQLPLKGTNINEVTTTGKEMFDLWYRDNLKYTKRVGFQLVLEETGVNTNQFVFDAAATTTSDPRFRPLDNIPACQATDGRLDCSNGGKLWPPEELDSDNSFTEDAFSAGAVYKEATGSKYLYTTEHHSFFQFQGNEIFEFAGDDDLWVFINGRLAIDVGGLHSLLTSRLNFANLAVQEGLNLTVGGFYSLDVFHAERHSTGSNFKITTSLAPGCNILDAGKPAYTWNESNLEEDWKLVGGPTWAIPVNGQIRLTDPQEFNTVGYAFLRNQVNVGAGFVINFVFNATNNGEGFAFVIQRDTITDLGGGSGGNLGFKNIKRSIAIAFDFCNDRNNPTVECNSRDVRLHYNLDGPEAFNSPSVATKRLRAGLIHPNELNDAAEHRVEIRYFDRSPPWLEVFIDDDLFLQKRDINVEEVIGGRNAWVGFTATTGPFAASRSTVSIQDFSVSTIAIEDKNSQSVNVPPPAPLTALANGRADISFSLRTFDFCLNPIEFGGSSARVRGLLTRIPDPVDEEDEEGDRRLLQDTSSSNDTIEAVVIDLENGFYQLNFSTTVVGNYSLEMWFGEGCSNGTHYVTASTETCFYESHANVATFTPVPPVEDPPEDPTDGLPQAVLTGVGVAAGVISFCGLVMIVVGVRIRNKWRREKAFVEAGKLAAAEKGVQYLGDTDLDMLQNKLQATLHAIQQERSRTNRAEDKQDVINELLRQKGELQEHVRRMKILRDGGDPDAKPLGAAAELGRRVRKSFAASRVSRGFSLRMESPIGRKDTQDSVGGNFRASTANPLFNFASRFSVSRNRAPLAIPPPPTDDHIPMAELAAPPKLPDI